MTIKDVINTKYLIAIKSVDSEKSNSYINNFVNTVPFFSGVPIPFLLKDGIVTVSSIVKTYQLINETISNIPTQNDDSEFTGGFIDSAGNITQDVTSILSKDVWTIVMTLVFTEEVSSFTGLLDAILAISDSARTELKKVKFWIVTKSIFMRNLYMTGCTHDVSRANQTITLTFTSEEPIKKDSTTKRINADNINNSEKVFPPG